MLTYLGVDKMIFFELAIYFKIARILRRNNLLVTPVPQP